MIEKKKRRRRCDHCGKLFDRDKVSKDIDPYIDELYPDEPNEVSWWCDDCYEERLDDI